MSELLSNDQIAELVAAAKEGELPTRPTQRRRQRRVRVVDFTLPTRFSADHQRRIERGHQGWCRGMGPVLSAELGTPVEFEVIDVSQLTYAAAVEELPPASVFGAVRFVGLDTRMLVAADGTAAAQIVHRMLGGAAADARMFGSEPTELELALVRRLFITFVSQLSPVWEEIAEVKLELAELDPKLTNIEIAPRSEPCLTLTIEIRMNERSSTMTIVVPFAAIEGVADRITLGGEHGGRGWTPADSDPDRMLSRLRAVEVEARAEVISRELPLDAILALRPGDLVPLRVPKSVGVTLAVGEVAVHRCTPGRNGERRAIEVVERMEAGS